LQSIISVAQDMRTQYPAALKNAYFGVKIGYINYFFSAAQLEPVFTVDAELVPISGACIVL
jgi:hypothetical protein